MVYHNTSCIIRYNFSITHVLGKALITADALSRVTLQLGSKESLVLQESAESFVSVVVEALSQPVLTI